MAKVVIAQSASDRLDDVIEALSLPVATRRDVRRRLGNLERFPLAGQQLTGAWAGFRRLVGDLRWMQLIYTYDAITDIVVVVAIEDARSSTAPTLL